MTQIAILSTPRVVAHSQERVGLVPANVVCSTFDEREEEDRGARVCAVVLWSLVFVRGGHTAEDQKSFSSFFVFERFLQSLQLRLPPFIMMMW